MADSTTGGLPTKKIGSMDPSEVYDDILVPGEFQGTAVRFSGKQIKDHAAAGAKKYTDQAQQHADAAAQSAQAASGSAGQSAASAQAAKTSEQNAEKYKSYIQNMTVTSTTLPAGSDATAKKTETSGSFRIDIGIPRGEDGTDFTIRGRYDTLAALKSAHPTGSPGDAWAVGPEEDVVIYVWDTNKRAWESIGPLRGPVGPQGPQGLKGDTGAAAGFGTISATVDKTTGTPSVKVTESGTNTAKSFSLAFAGLKGETGEKGEKGDQGTAAGFGTISASVDGSTGNPSVKVIPSGTNASKNFTFAFTGLKGEPGASGPEGPPGVSGQGVPTGGNPGQILKKLDSSNYSTVWDNEKVYVGSCTSSSSSVEKTIEIGGFTLISGVTVIAKFTYSNTATNPTLNVSGTGAKPIKLYNGTDVQNNDIYSWTSGAVVPLYYDGTNWIIIGRYNLVPHPAALGFYFNSCTTADDVKEKTVTASNYRLTDGSMIAVKFRNKVIAESTLNVNNTGAKRISFRGNPITDGIINAGDVAFFVYASSATSGFNLVAVDRKIEQSSNQNMFDNWYFIDPINQRELIGTSSKTDFVIDRWSVDSSYSGSNASAKVVSGDSITIANKLKFSQRIRKSDLKAGEVVCFSVLTDKGLFSVSGDLPSSISTIHTYSTPFGTISFDLVNGSIPYYRFEIYHNNLQTTKLYAAKLETGSTQTLAHQENGTWVLNDPPPNKAVELVKCQRYYRFYGAGITAMAQYPYLTIIFPFENEMVSNPTCTLLQSSSPWFSGSADLVISNCVIGGADVRKNGILYISIYGTNSKVTADGAIYRYNSFDPLISLDAEF